MKITTIGLDLAKNVFQVHGADVNPGLNRDHYPGVKWGHFGGCGSLSRQPIGGPCSPSKGAWEEPFVNAGVKLHRRGGVKVHHLGKVINGGRWRTERAQRATEV